VVKTKTKVRTGRKHRKLEEETVTGLPNIDPFAGDLLGSVVHLLKLPVDVGDDYFSEIEGFLDESIFYSIIREAKPEKVNKAIDLRKKGTSRKDTLKELGISPKDFSSGSTYERSLYIREIASKYLDGPLDFLEDNLKILSEEVCASCENCYGPIFCPLIFVKHISKNGLETVRKIRKTLLEGSTRVE